MTALLAAVPFSRVLAQGTGGTADGSADTAGAASPGSAPADTAGRAPADTLARGDTLARRDTLARQDTSAARDTTARPQTGGSAPAPVPVDSALGAACEESSGNPPDLLTVKFQPTTTAREREAAAREIGGTLVGPSEHTAPGAWYIRAPGAAGPSLADRLIVMPSVLEVGNTRCPPQGPIRP